MQIWKWQTQVSVALGALFFFAIFVPILIFQYRRYGRVSVARTLGAAAVAMYSVALLVFTMLPLPHLTEQWCATHPKPFQTDPLRFLEDIRALRRADGGTSWLDVVRSFTFLQVAFNVVFFIPFGVIMRGFFKVPWFLALLLGCVTSVLIEFTQYTGVWGLFPCAYRQGDVDDILTNTLGALIGIVLAPLLLRWMPSGSQLANARDEPRPITAVRRWFGMFLDAVFVWLLAFVFTVAFGLINHFDRYFGVLTGQGGFGAGHEGRMAQARAAGTSVATDSFTLPPWQLIIAWLLAALLVFYLPACFGDGSSLGKRTVWLKSQWRTHVAQNDGDAAPPSWRVAAAAPAWRDGALLQRLWRATISGGVYTLLDAASSNLDGAWGAVFLVLCVVLVCSVPFSRTKRGLSGALTRSRLADTRA